MSDINPFRFLRNGILLSTRARNITVKHVRGIWNAVSALALCFGEAASASSSMAGFSCPIRTQDLASGKYRGACRALPASSRRSWFGFSLYHSRLDMRTGEAPTR